MILVMGKKGENKVWRFIKARRKSTIVFVVSLILLLIAIGIFQMTLNAQSAEIAVYIETVSSGEEGNFTPITPSVVAFGFVLLMGLIWGGSFIAILLRGAKKTLFVPLKNDWANIFSMFDTSRLERQERQDKGQK